MMRDFIQEYCHIFEGQKIKIPAGFSRIKIDVGLSSNAPQSEMWLRRDPDLLVFGFLPSKLPGSLHGGLGFFTSVNKKASSNKIQLSNDISITDPFSL